jgi:hypothetical protein
MLRGSRENGLSSQLVTTEFKGSIKHENLIRADSITDCRLSRKVCFLLLATGAIFRKKKKHCESHELVGKTCKVNEV